MRIQIRKSLYDKLDSLEESLEDQAKQNLMRIAQDAVYLSKPFVDTGAFITSWQIHSGGRGRPRGKSSHGKPRRQSAEIKAAEAMQQLISDIAKVDISNNPKVVLRNGATHARYVDAKYPRVEGTLRKKYG